MTRRYKLTKEIAEQYTASVKDRAFQDYIAGAKIVGMRKATTAEAIELGFFERPTLLILDNGNKICASSDEEGNAPGVFFAVAANTESYYMFPNEDEVKTEEDKNEAG